MCQAAEKRLCLDELFSNHFVHPLPHTADHDGDSDLCDQISQRRLANNLKLQYVLVGCRYMTFYALCSSNRLMNTVKSHTSAAWYQNVPKKDAILHPEILK